MVLSFERFVLRRRWYGCGLGEDVEIVVEECVFKRVFLRAVVLF